MEISIENCDITETSPSERWLKKAAEWNPELSSRYRTKRAIGRPMKRWEDDINDFLKQNFEEKENEEPLERKSQNNNIWMNIAKDRKNGLDLKKNTQGNVQNDRKEICNVVLEQSSSSTAIKSNVMTKAVAVQRLRAR